MRNRVAELRRERNMRQEELAAAVGISRQSLAADLQQDSFILGRLHSVFPPYLFLSGIDLKADQSLHILYYFYPFA